VSTVDLTYDSARRLTEEKVTKAGPTVTYHRQYAWDKANRRTKVTDALTGWYSTFTNDASGRMQRIVNVAGAGGNPFPWPQGVTNVTSDANGNVVQLWGRDPSGNIWKISHELDYEQRVKRIILNNGDIIENVYDGMGNRLKELTTSGGSTTEKRFINAFGRVIQERDASDTVTARYYWENGRMFKKDYGVNTKYFIPEIRNSPLTTWNNAGTFQAYELYDAFGIIEDSTGTKQSPFELRSAIRVNNSHLTVTTLNQFSWPELGRNVDGFFQLVFAKGGGCDCPSCRFIYPVVSYLDGGGGVGGEGGGGGCGSCVDPDPSNPCQWCVYCASGGGGGDSGFGGREIGRFNTYEAFRAYLIAQRALCGCGGDGPPPPPPRDGGGGGDGCTGAGVSDGKALSIFEGSGEDIIPVKFSIGTIHGYIPALESEYGEITTLVPSIVLLVAKKPKEDPKDYWCKILEAAIEALKELGQKVPRSMQLVYDCVCKGIQSPECKDFLKKEGKNRLKRLIDAATDAKLLADFDCCYVDPKTEKKSDTFQGARCEFEMPTEKLFKCLCTSLGAFGEGKEKNKTGTEKCEEYCLERRTQCEGKCVIQAGILGGVSGPRCRRCCGRFYVTCLGYCISEECA